MLNINLEQLIGNSFAIYLDRTGKRTLTVRKLEDFGYAIIHELENEDIHACLSDSFDKLPEFIAEYPDWFSSVQNDGLIILHKSVSVDDLFDKFSVSMTPYAMYAFASDGNLKILLA